MADVQEQTQAKSFFVYGEDGLTLWALKKKLGVILGYLEDNTDPYECEVFYRPSFGRGRGCFGEFDFIVLSKNSVYLGESKWTSSSEKTENGVMLLRPEQPKRHRILRTYIKEWDSNRKAEWPVLAAKVETSLRRLGLMDKVPSEERVLANSIRSFCKHIEHFFPLPESVHVTDVFLYFFDGSRFKPRVRSCEGYVYVALDYSEDDCGGFILV